MSKISIITASYNYEGYIVETIESVINQTFQDWEMIIVDDGSKDNSVDVIKSYCEKDSRIKLFQHENGKNKGLAETLQLGIKNASADWIVFLESDDTITPDYLEEKLKVAEQYPDVKFIFNDVNMFGDEEIINNLNSWYFPKFYKTCRSTKFPCNVLSLFKKRNIVPTFSCVMLHKEALKNVNWDAVYKPLLDYYLWVQIALNNEFYYIDKKMTNWRMHGNSYVRNKDISENSVSYFYTIQIRDVIARKSRFPMFIKFVNRINYIMSILKNYRKKCIQVHFNANEQKVMLFNKVLFEIKKQNPHIILNLCGLKIKTKGKYFSHKNSKTKAAEKDIIKNSQFWDVDWYIDKYHKTFDRQKALEYWYSKGWKKGELPSKYFDKNYLKFCEKMGENPIILYLSKEPRTFVNTVNPYKSENDKERIKEYLAYKPTRKAKGVVYTCITNDYDDIREIEIYGYVDKDWDYVCFTDNQDDINQGQIGVWEIKPLQFGELDNTRNNRWHKLNPHKLFPEYEQSIYIDPNINIITEHLFKMIEEMDLPFILPKHFKNNCIYQEYNDVLGAKLDDASLINTELDLIKKSGMPPNYGFCENNILYRKHNLQKIISIDSEWWDMVKNYSKRDQLSLVYLFWKNGMKIEDITFENSRIYVDNFYVFAHKKGGS